MSGFFIKNSKYPIEPKIAINGADSRTLTWANAPSAEVLGVEVEGRKNFEFVTPALADLFVFTNASLIKSTAFVKK